MSSRHRTVASADRDGFRRLKRRPVSSSTSPSEAPRDADGLLLAVMPGNRYGLRGAARHIGPFGRHHSRRKSMCPIPGKIICRRVRDVARRRRCDIHQGFANRRPVEGVVPKAGPEEPRIVVVVVSPVMPERSGGRPMRSRMRRSNPSTRCGSRPGECLVRGKQKRYCA